MHLAASGVVALSAAGTFAVSAVLQQRAARVAPAADALTFRLFGDLLHQPLWLAGTASLVLGYLLQALALGLGNVSFVAPIIVTELIFAVPLAARSEHRRPGRREWLGAACVVGGVGVFLTAASPHGGHPDPAMLVWALMLASGAAVIGGALALAGKAGALAGGVGAGLAGCAEGAGAGLAGGAGAGRGGTVAGGAGGSGGNGKAICAQRAALLAVAAGVTFGLLAVFTKNVTFVLQRDGAGVLAAWQLYALIGVGIVGFLFSQSAYQAASLRYSLPVIDALEPTVAVLAASAAFGEHLAHDPGSLALELVGAAVAFVGVFVVGRSQLVLSIYQPR